MAQTTIYIIDKTDPNEPSFAIQPRTLDGYAGVQRNTDLTLYGNAAPDWGERFNENFYRLLENFACPDKGELGSPVVVLGIPQDEGDLGAGYGINRPARGQLWFNKTNNTLYVCSDPDTNTWVAAGTGVTISDISGLQDALDEKVDRAGDSGLTGTHSWPALFLNEGNGSVAAGSDIRMDADGLISAGGSLRLNIDNDNSGAGVLLVAKGAQTSAATPLFRVEIDGTLHSDISNYETLVTNDDDIPNKKYVDDEISSAVGGLPTYVLKTGDTMTGSLVIDVPTLPGVDSILELRSNSGPALKMFSDSTTFGASAPPAIQLYNPDNDPNTVGAPAGYYPYVRFNNRDGTLLSIEADLDDSGASIGTNTETILNVAQSTGVLQHLGITGVTTENTVRTPNATISNINANNKNLTTKEYVDAEIAAIAGTVGGTVVAQSLAQNGYMRFSNGFVVQWGRNNPTSGGTGNWTYDVTLPLALDIGYTVITNIYATSPPAGGDVDRTGGAFNGVSAIRLFSLQDASHAMGWVAIGYKA